jgi:hypothetical protein
MVHCGFEGTAVTDSVKKPWKLIPLQVRGVKTEGPMAPEISLANQRPAEFVFSRHVEHKLTEIRSRKTVAEEVAAAE